MSYNNDNLLDYDLWCHDNRDKLYDYFHSTESHRDQFEEEFYQNEYDHTIIEDGHRISKYDIPSKDQAIKATLAKYPMMSVASATYYVVEVLGYSEHS